MNESKRTIWFPAKTYGWGWGPPVCWQGWVVMAIYLALLLGGLCWLTPGKPAFVGYVIGLSAALIAVCWWKGEKPAWRWGRPKK